MDDVDRAGDVVAAVHRERRTDGDAELVELPESSGALSETRATRTRTPSSTVSSRIAAADVAMERLRRALDAGWDPVELREQYNAAAAEKRSAEKALAATQNDQGTSRDELESHIDRLGGMAQALDRADREELTELYAALRLSLRYDHIEKTVDVEVDPMADRVAKLRVRGGTRTLTTCIGLNA